MKKIYLVSVLVLALVMSAFGQQYSYDYETMTMDQYQVELQKWQDTEAQAKADIEKEKAKIEELKGELTGLQNETKSTWDEIYGLVGTDEAGFNAYMSDLNNLSGSVSALLSSSPDDIYRNMNELKEYQAKLDELKKDKRSLLTEAQNKIASIQGMISQAIEKAKSANASYTVNRGDYLWKIAKNPNVYGDPFAWVRLWTANRNIIKDPNLIYPGQILNVHRVAGPSEYVVQRGEFLYKIAKDALGNAFKWQQLYETNKDVIGDNPAVIYPHMVLQLPQ
ncbi:MAG: hypothetical protein Kow00108_08970 [Calditrichia bacterium]